MKNIIKAFNSTFMYVLCVTMIALAAFPVSPMQAFLGSWAVVEGLAFVIKALPSAILGADVYSDTVLQAARAFIKDENNKKFMLRPNFTNLIEIFMRDREFTLPNLAALRQATTQTTTAMYLNKKTFTVGTTKGCTPSGEQSGSDSVDLTWATKNVILKSNFKQHAGNVVTAARAFANDLYNAEVSLWEAVDAALLVYLDANKSGVNAGGSGHFDDVHDIMWIANSNESLFYNLVTADMYKNNYNPMFLEAHDTMWTAKQRQYVNQGAGNSANTAFQFAGFEFFPSNLITPGVIGSDTYNSLHYIVPTGGVAILDWNEPINRAGKSIGTANWFTMQSILRPEFTFDVYKTTACADTSSSGGGTQDFVETWEISLNYALAKQPVITADETAIFKYGVASNSTFVS